MFLQHLDIRRLLALRALHDVERDLLLFFQGFETLGLDCRVVREDIFAAAIGSDKAKTFCIVEPLNRTGCHISFLITDNKKM